MMDFVINDDELAAMSGLPHIQQVAYLRGIRPYMDVKTGLVGIKRRISYQSIIEQLYVEPHPGIKAQSFSRDQVRRAVSGLIRAGIIEMQSEGMQLILKCSLAKRTFSVQNKAAINPPQIATINPHEENLMDTGFRDVEKEKADIVKSPKAATPLNSNNNYIFLLGGFDRFWTLYPLKNSELRAWQIFQELNPSKELITQILRALENQISYIQRQQSLGRWVPNWKNPANWLAQGCWNDVIPVEQPLEEINHAKNQNCNRKQEATDSLWALCKPTCDEPESPNSNVIKFSKRGG
jgi:hypothetical protein